MDILPVSWNFTSHFYLDMKEAENYTKRTIKIEVHGDCASPRTCLFEAGMNI